MPESFKKELGQRIRDLRKNLGYSQQEVAQKLGIHRPSVSQIESGERDLSAEELTKISEFFGVPMNEITEKKLKEEQKETKKKAPGNIKITFFRHGEAIDDLYNQYGGWADQDLSPKGISKAYTAAQELKRKGVTFDIIYTSPLKRARQKAEILARELQVDIKVLQYLKERNTYGLLCGINKNVAQKKFPDLVKTYESGKYVLASERYEDFVSRLSLIFDYIKRSEFNNVCCITHGKLITGIAKHMLKMKPENLDEDCMLIVGLDKEGMYYIQSEGVSFTK